jgi:uncharacterized damage-inducible protein DinB
MHRPLWFDRRFQLGLPPEAFPFVVERVRGAPPRLEDRISGLPPAILTKRVEGAWSIQENVGHLGDLEPLWAGRLDDLVAGRAELRPADLQNRKTHEAGHNDRAVGELLEAFRQARLATVARLDELSSEQVTATALHPRLQQPMSVVDLFFFVAEHDDHHFAQITALARTLAAV